MAPLLEDVRCIHCGQLLLRAAAQMSTARPPRAEIVCTRRSCRRWQPVKWPDGSNKPPSR